MKKYIILGIITLFIISCYKQTDEIKAWFRNTIVDDIVCESSYYLPMRDSIIYELFITTRREVIRDKYGVEVSDRKYRVYKLRIDTIGGGSTDRHFESQKDLTNYLDN